MRRMRTDCCIAGGGPAGMMLGLLLARAGLDVVVLEKHGDFFRDFRGDTIHPATLSLLGELGLREDFLALPHDRVTRLDAVVGGNRLHPIDFGRLKPPNDALVIMPQWDFLTFLATTARAYPGFHLLMNTAGIGLLGRDGRVAGASALGEGGDIRIEAKLTVAADGRDSILRASAGLSPQRFGVPIDVLWFRLPKPPDASPTTLAYLTASSLLLTIDRGSYVQVGFVIPKGSFPDLRAAGIAAFHRAVLAAAPHLGPVIGAIDRWDEVHLLSVQVDRLARWGEAGFICIGDAAHAMSPAFGVGVNFAIQDAVALANAVSGPLGALEPGEIVGQDVLAGVQARRMPAVRRMQRIQLAVHRRFAKPARGPILPNPMPRPLRMAVAALTPVVQTVAARAMSSGFRPEHPAPALTRPARPELPRAGGGR